MENLGEEYNTERLEQILKDHMTGVKAYSGEVILEVCEELAKRETSDASGIYRRYLTDLFPEDMKKDL